MSASSCVEWVKDRSDCSCSWHWPHEPLTEAMLCHLCVYRLCLYMLHTGRYDIICDSIDQFITLQDECVIRFQCKSHRESTLFEDMTHFQAFWYSLFPELDTGWVIQRRNFNALTVKYLHKMDQKSVFSGRMALKCISVLSMKAPCKVSQALLLKPRCMMCNFTGHV